MKKPSHLAFVVLVNILVFIALFAVLELAHRIYRDGFADAFVNIIKRPNVPYLNLGTSNWVIYDEELGYRLNPARSNINSLSVRHDEIAVPKPEGVYRIVVLVRLC
jgi:hypothetical protein